MKYNHIRANQEAVWIKVLHNEGIDSTRKIQKELNLIDDLLTLQQNHAILNPKNHIQEVLEKRIALDAKQPTDESP